MGRADYQVKVRGFRIELGEIEAALGRHPAIRETVVRTWDVAHQPGERRLVAYFVPEPGQTPTSADLRDLARQTLPDYMVPAAFVALDALPLTPNGKVNRRALPPPERSSLDQAAFVAPSGPVEELVAQIWTEALGLERVGARDNFFELGGHSILATQVLSRVRDAVQVEVPLAHFFEAPTISQLALTVEDAILAQLEPPVKASALAEAGD